MLTLLRCFLNRCFLLAFHLCRLDDYDESELNLIDDCLAKKHGELFTFGGKSYILTHEGRFMCISEVKRIEFDSMEVL